MTRVFDVGHEERACAVFLCQIDCDAKIHALAFEAHGCAVELCVAVVELWKLFERAQDGERDQVCVRSFAAIVFSQVLIDDPAVFVQQLYGNSAFGSGSRNVETALHVLDDLECRSANGNCFGVCWWRRSRRLWLRSTGRRRRWSRSRSIRWNDGGFCTIATQFTEIRPPRPVHQFGVAAEALQETFDVRGVCAELLSDNLG